MALTLAAMLALSPEPEPYREPIWPQLLGGFVVLGLGCFVAAQARR